MIKYVMKVKEFCLYFFKQNLMLFTISIILLIILLVMRNSHQFTFVSTLIAFFGLIFVVLKYYLDRANYKKSLFEKRYLIFQTCDEVLYGFFHCIDNKDAWRILVEKLNSIYRRSYFLFGNETYKFILKFRESIIIGSMNDNVNDEKVKAANSFLRELLNSQELAKKFTELKIYSY